MAWTERYVRDDADGSGDGTTNANSGATGAWTLTQAITNVAAGHRVNVKAGTYANTTTTRTFVNAGTTTAPIWWRGFNTTIGDIDTDDTLAKPLFTFTTGRAIFSGAHQTVWHLDIVVTGAVANNALQVTGGTVWLHRVSVDNQQANAASGALAMQTAGGAMVTASYFKSTTTATRSVLLAVAVEMLDCYVEGGIAGIDINSSIPNVTDTIVANATTNGILFTTASSGGCKARNCTIYNCGTNGINLTSATVGMTISRCLFVSCTNGINNTTGADTNIPHRAFNAFYNVTNQEVGFGDSPTVGSVTESSTPLTNAAGGDFSLVAGALSHTVFPVEGVATTSYPDLGAVQSEAASGGGISRARLPSGLSAVG